MESFRIVLKHVAIVITILCLGGCSPIQSMPLTDEEIAHVQQNALDLTRGRTYDLSWNIIKQEYDKNQNKYIVYMSNGTESCKLVYDLPLTSDLQGKREEWDNDSHK